VIPAVSGPHEYRPWSIESRLCSSSKAAVGNDGRFVYAPPASGHLPHPAPACRFVIDSGPLEMRGGRHYTSGIPSFFGKSRP
jgi:hypothetical protein